MSAWARRQLTTETLIVGELEAYLFVDLITFGE